MTAWCVRGPAARSVRLWLAAALLAAAAASPAAADEPTMAPSIVVMLDQARIIKIPDRAATVVIGNPLIADLTIEPGDLAVITGKSYGTTNLVVLDRSGAVLIEHIVEVDGPSDRTVVVYRGIDRQTYSCMPDCQPRITLGDEQTAFNNLMTEATTRNNQSLAAGAAR